MTSCPKMFRILLTGVATLAIPPGHGWPAAQVNLTGGQEGHPALLPHNVAGRASITSSKSCEDELGSSHRRTSSMSGMTHLPGNSGATLRLGDRPSAAPSSQHVWSLVSLHCLFLV